MRTVIECLGGCGEYLDVLTPFSEPTADCPICGTEASKFMLV